MLSINYRASDENYSKKDTIAIAPFLFFIGNMLLISALSSIESSPLDSDWKTRQLIIGFSRIAF